MRIAGSAVFIAAIVLVVLHIDLVVDSVRASSLMRLLPEPSRVRLDVTPITTVAPIGEWHLRAWVQRDDFNRTLRVEAHGADYDRVSEIPLEGSLAPRVFDVWWRGRVPCGSYVVAASVLGPSGQLLNQALKQATICVQVEEP